MNGCEFISKAKVAISVCCCEPTSPPPASPSPHHQIIAKYLLMFFFHPSKRWSYACSSAPFWVCCVWRQCSASERSEVKGGHWGKPGARLCEPARGSPSPPTPANLSPRGDGGWRPPVPFSPLCPGAAPCLPARAGRGKRMWPSCPPRGDAAALRVRGRGGGRQGTPPDPQLTPMFNFSTYTYSNRWVSVLDQSCPRSHFPFHLPRRVRA